MTGQQLVEMSKELAGEFEALEVIAEQTGVSVTEQLRRVIRLWVALDDAIDLRRRGHLARAVDVAMGGRDADR